MVLMSAVCGCGHAQPPVAPGPAIPADPPAELRGMIEECDALIVALTTFKACPNLEEADRQDLDAWIERAGKDFVAGRKTPPEANAQSAIALACSRATRSVTAATERCRNGKRPKDGWYEPR
jgi:hypothetical protein